MLKEEAIGKECPFKFSDMDAWYGKWKDGINCQAETCMAWVEVEVHGVKRGYCGLIPGMRQAG